MHISCTLYKKAMNSLHRLHSMYFAVQKRIFYVKSTRVSSRRSSASICRMASRIILPVIFVAAGILLSLSGLVAGSLVAGTLTMEILFGLPGIGSLALNAIQGRDTPVVLAAVSFIAVSLVLINTVVDALHKLFDPRMTP